VDRSRRRPDHRASQGERRARQTRGSSSWRTTAKVSDRTAKRCTRS
jgi:hypothetical protein